MPATYGGLSNASSGTSTFPNVVTPGYPASGVTAVTGTFAATGQSASLTPIAGRAFNVMVRGTFVATVQLERSLDAGSTWQPLTWGGAQIYYWTGPASETCQDDQTGVQFRLNCTSYTSGTVTYRLSQ